MKDRKREVAASLLSGSMTLKNEEDSEIIQAIERMKAQGADVTAINANIKAMIKTALNA